MDFMPGLNYPHFTGNRISSDQIRVQQKCRKYTQKEFHHIRFEFSRNAENIHIQSFLILDKNLVGMQKNAQITFQHIISQFTRNAEKYADTILSFQIRIYQKCRTENYTKNISSYYIRIYQKCKEKYTKTLQHIILDSQLTFELSKIGKNTQK